MNLCGLVKLFCLATDFDLLKTRSSQLHKERGHTARAVFKGLSTHLLLLAGSVMRIVHHLLFFSCAVGVIALTGCTSTLSGRCADVTVTSNPPNAHVAIQDQAGNIVARGVTPMTASLDRSGFLLRKPPRYTAILQKDGYETQEVDIKATLSPWILANLAIGAPLGRATQAATDAMWILEPNEINRSLAPARNQSYARSESHSVMQTCFVSDQSQ